MKVVFAAAVTLTIATALPVTAFACSAMKSASSGDVLATVLPAGPQSKPVVLPTTKKPSADNS